MSDTRTNSGVDNISTFRKMHYWSVPGERIVTLMTAGNLATTQAVVSVLERRSELPENRRNRLLDASSMFEVAGIVGDVLRQTISKSDANNPSYEKGAFNASIIIAGQIAGMRPCLFMVYPEGNFIEASADTPFFQIGETKYGRPILLRGYDKGMAFESAVKLLMVSFDSTIKANLSVAMPLDVLVVQKDNFEPLHDRRLVAEDPWCKTVSNTWAEQLRLAIESLPDYNFESAD